MSDQIFINDNTVENNVAVVAQDSLVLTVNGKIGNVILTKYDIGLDQVDNTSDLNKPISNAVLSALLLKTDVDTFNVLNDFILTKYGSWDSVYAYVKSSSGVEQAATSFVTHNSAIILNVNGLVNVFNGDWNHAYDWVNKNQNNATFNSVSAIALSGIFYGDGSNLIGASLPGQQDINTLIQSNSSYWNYSFDVSVIYQNASGSFATNTQLESVSSLLTPLTITNELTSQLVLNSDYGDYKTSVAETTSTLLPTIIYQNTSGSFATNTLLESVSSLLTPLTVANELTGQLVLNADFESYQTSVAISSATLLPTSVYQNASGSFATNTQLESVSSLLTPLSLTEKLTSQLILNSEFDDYQTSVANTTATLLPTSVYQNASGNWESAYTSWSSISATSNVAFNDTRFAKLSSQAFTLVNATTSITTVFGLNVASGVYSSVIGGSCNIASGDCSNITGGRCNIASACYANVNSGVFNCATGIFSTAVNGRRNTASGAYSNVNGGVLNCSVGNYSNVSGGCFNSASGIYSNVGGGCANAAVGNWSVIGGGTNNRTCTICTVVAGGTFNRAEAVHSSVLGGRVNVASGSGSSVVGGRNNTASGVYSSVAGGCGNIASGRTSFIAAGSGNNTQGFTNTFILGSNINASQENFTFVNNLSSLGVVSTVNGNSNQWNSAYTNIIANSAAYISTPVYGTSEQIIATPGDNNSVTLSLPNSITTPGDLNVTGSLFVNGTAANINSINLSLSDTLIYLGEGNVSNVMDIGFVGNYTPAPSAYQHTGLVRVARDNKWTLFSGVSAEPTTVVDFAAGYVIDTLRANIEGTLFGNVSGDVTGNAGSVTNGVYTNESYSDPSWIDSLSDTKLIGNKFATNTDVNSLTGFLNNNLTNFVTSVAASTATLLPTTVYQEASGNWQNAYTSWRDASATSVVNFNDTRFAKLTSQAYTFDPSICSIDTVAGANIASGVFSSVLGGNCNTASAKYAAIASGRGNTASAYSGTIAGGRWNCVLQPGVDVFIGGGSCNIACGNNSVVAGGNRNQAMSGFSAVIGGQSNCVTGNYSSIGGGCGNIATNIFSTVAGGRNNTASGYNSTVAGGGSCYNPLEGGCVNANIASGVSSSVGGGGGNTASGNFSNVGGGRNNTASGIFSSVLGGRDNNTNSLSATFIIGQGITAPQANYTYVNNISSQGLVVASGGNSNLWNSVYSTVNSNSAITWNYQGTDLKALSSNWQSAYTSWNATSASYTTNSILNTVSSVLLPTSIYQNASGDWQRTFTTVNTNSGNWGSGNTSVNSLVISNSSNWNVAYNYSTVFSQNSSTYNATTTFVNTNSSNWGSGNTSVNSLVASNSSNWNIAYNYSTVFSQNSSTYNATTTLVNTNSALWGLGLAPYGELTSASFDGNGITNVFDLSSTSSFTIAAGYIVSLNGSLQVPNKDYVIVYSSGTNRLSTNFVPRIGSSLSVITLSNKPFSNDVTTLVNTSSAIWNSAYTTVNTNSATWAVGGGSSVDTDVRALTGNWQSAYTSWNTVSATSTVTFNDSRFARLSSQPYTLTNLTTSSIVPLFGSNSAVGVFSVVVGGGLNISSNINSAVVAGCCNVASGINSTVLGGFRNTSSGYRSAVINGVLNVASGAGSVIAGGSNNISSGQVSFASGVNNTSSGYASTAIGWYNTASGCRSAVSGGSCNSASGFNSNIGGGAGNSVSGLYSNIGGGRGNRITGFGSSVLGGLSNTVTGNSSSILGGQCNVSSGNNSFVLGGSANDTRGFANTFILGTSLSANRPNYTFVNNLSVQGNIESNTNYTATLSLTANQTALNASDVFVNLDPKNDPNNWFNRGTRRFLPTVQGYYHFDYQLSWQPGVSGGGNQNNIQIRKNGSTSTIVQQPINGSGTNTSQHTSAILYFNGSTDYVDFTAYSSNASQVIVGESSGTWTKVEIFKIN